MNGIHSTVPHSFELAKTRVLKFVVGSSGLCAICPPPATPPWLRRRPVRQVLLVAQLGLQRLLGVLLDVEVDAQLHVLAGDRVDLLSKSSPTMLPAASIS